MSTLVKRGNSSDELSTPSTFTGMVDRFFNDNLNRMFNDDYWGFSGLQHQMSVPANLKETDKTYELELVAPGLRKEDFTLNLSDDMLTVNFEHKEENKDEGKDEGWLRKEYRMRSFSRSFHLDETIDANKISAQYRDGILQLTLPKKQGAQRMTRNIEIK